MLEKDASKKRALDEEEGEVHILYSPRSAKFSPASPELSHNEDYGPTPMSPGYTPMSPTYQRNDIECSEGVSKKQKQ